jgi:hypothetical protein
MFLNPIVLFLAIFQTGPTYYTDACHVYVVDVARAGELAEENAG